MGLDDEPYQDDEGWNGRNVCQCVDKSWRTGLPVAEAAKWITPVGITDAEGSSRSEASRWPLSVGDAAWPVSSSKGHWRWSSSRTVNPLS